MQDSEKKRDAGWRWTGENAPTYRSLSSPCSTFRSGSGGWKSLYFSPAWTPRQEGLGICYGMFEHMPRPEPSRDVQIK